MRLGCSFELGLQSSEDWTGAGGSSPVVIYSYI